VLGVFPEVKTLSHWITPHQRPWQMV
jgi:hypothetical protein